MKINWIYKEFAWAFETICKHYSRAMPGHEHVLNADSNEDADVNFLCTPNQIKGNKDRSKTILHLDSNRWYQR